MPQIIFFDGVCNLCNNSVDFIMRRDNRRVFRYAPLQWGYAQNLLQDYQVDTSAMSTIILLKNEKVYNRSNAALEIARDLRFPWPLLYAFKIVPRFIRDWVYDIVSRNRYNWFGKKDTCRVPTAEESSLFLEGERLPTTTNTK